MSLTVGMVGHIVFGGVGIISGFAAFIIKKGTPNHILIGRIYVISMLLMAMTGFYYAYIRSVNITMLAACLTCYLVVTSWLAVQRSFKQAWVSKYAPAIIGLPVVTYGLFLSWRAMHGVTDDFGSFVVPGIKYYEFTAVVCIAFTFDLITVLGKKLTHKQRIYRHIWRMAFTLYIACSSFFQGQAKLFPESLRYSFWLGLPEKMVLVLMLYWLFNNQVTYLINKIFCNK